MEFRLWQVCEQRFTVLKPKRVLSELDPVDLGATHEHRLQYKLARMSRRAEGREWRAADYAVVLHGPPGSSKTAITEALARQMWRVSQRLDGIESRLVRITPADFTRGGEGRLDSQARMIFDILGRMRNVTILFDEVDDLLRQRVPTERPTFLKIIVPAMLNRLQDLRDACPHQQVFFVLATNYVEKIEPALIRKGRIDEALPVVYLDGRSRSAIIGKLERKLRDKQGGWAEALRPLLCGEKLEETRGWPWLTLNAMLKELGKEIAARATQAPDEQGLQWISDIVDKYKSSVAASSYEARLKDNCKSAELRYEILYDMFSRAETVEEYIEGLSGLSRLVPDEILAVQARKLWSLQGR